MRLDLGQLSIQGLALERPSTDANPRPKRVLVQRADALQGVLVQTASAFQLSNVACAELALAQLDWRFGSLQLESEQPTVLTGLAADVGNTAGELELDLALTGLRAQRLSLAIGALTLSARVEAHDLQLQSGPGLASLRAQRALFSELELRTGTLTLTMPELTVSDLLIDWSGDQLRVEARTLSGSTLALERADATLRASELSLTSVRLLGSDVQLNSAQVARLELTLPLSPASSPGPTTREPAAPIEPSPASPPLFDYALLDGLAGQLDVDVAVDLAVPYLGRRRATHELRIAIEDGALDYRELERNLAPLEDSLLDFSVREGALVLERGLPMIATRGRGKPIVIWPLGPEDLVLAELQRVRLSVLPTARLASSTDSEPPEEPREEGGSGFRLRHLTLQNIAAALRLTGGTVERGALADLSFENLTVRGTVHHDPEGPKQPGQLDVTLEGLGCALRTLAIGTHSLSAVLVLGALRELHVGFEDVRPQHVRALGEGLFVTDLVFTSSGPVLPA
jgi:hypothetical protein